VNSLKVKDYSPTVSFYGIDQDGQLFRWLLNQSYDRLQPLSAPGVESWRRVSASGDYVIAIDDQNHLWTWDKGMFVFSASDVGIPAALPQSVTNFLDIAVTRYFAMALTDHGELYAWGHAAPGTWSDPTAKVASVPELVQGLPNLLDANSLEIASSFLETTASSTNVTIRLAAPAGSAVSIQSSTDLVNWTDAENVTAQAGVTAVDLPLDQNGGRFYRIAR
jgi:hypothetical protein